jgi:apolipoprotein N-acyltransferase
MCLAILSGFMLTAAFPNIGAGWLAFCALVPLFISINNLSAFDCFRLGFLTGFVHYISLVYWSAYTMSVYGDLPWALSIPAMFLLACYLALYPAFFSLIISRQKKKPLLFLLTVPVLWVSCEYVRSFLLSGFPWELLGYSQYKETSLIQIAEFSGVYGLSFLIACINGIIYIAYLGFFKKILFNKEISKKLSICSLTGGAIIICLVWIFGKYEIKQIGQLIKNSKSVKITVVQGNIDQSIKWDPKFQQATIEKYLKLSFSAAQENPELVVWPETAAPFYYQENSPLTFLIQSGIADFNKSFIIGSPSYSFNGNEVKYFNSAYLLGPDGSLAGKYDKVHLVPFGEYVPLKRLLPFVGKMVQQIGDFAPGEKGKTLLWEKGHIGILICYEIIFPYISRLEVQNNSSLLINMTNDAWYGRTGAPYQHFSMAVLRAVENRRSLVRAANTGISGFIDPAGRIVSATNLYEDAVLTNTVPLLEHKTFYTRFGDVFCRLCAGLTILFFWFGIRKYGS